MPISCKCILDHMVYKGAMTEEERDKVVRNLKTQKAGKWIDDGQYAEGHSEHEFHCSVCGGYIIDYVCQVYAENPHCKWCGAEMEGSAE